jgi:hypothetical protein
MSLSVVLTLLQLVQAKRASRYDTIVKFIKFAKVHVHCVHARVRSVFLLAMVDESFSLIVAFQPCAMA